MPYSEKSQGRINSLERAIDNAIWTLSQETTPKALETLKDYLTRVLKEPTE